MLNCRVLFIVDFGRFIVLQTVSKTKMLQQLLGEWSLFAFADSFQTFYSRIKKVFVVFVGFFFSYLKECS